VIGLSSGKHDRRKSISAAAMMIGMRSQKWFSLFVKPFPVDLRQNRPDPHSGITSLWPNGSVIDFCLRDIYWLNRSVN
jgi:hypothetical protein